MSRERLQLLLAGLAATLILARLAADLPADAFLTGDSGVKLVAVRNAVAHPDRPFDIDFPIVNGRPLPDLMDPFYSPHGDHAHAATSPIFPLMAAPFYSLWGLRGLALLPLGAFVAALLGLVAILRRLDAEGGGRQASVIWLGLAMIPLLFYGLEFWEHSCAAAFAYASTALFLGSAEVRRRPLSSGMLMGAAIIMRPEALCYLIALVVADRVRSKRAPVADLVGFAAGTGLGLLPLSAYNFLHFGTVVGPHIAANVVRIDSQWLTGRWALVLEWLWPGTLGGAALVTAALAASVLSVVAPNARRVAGLIVLSAAACLATLAARRAFPLESWWAALPASLVLLTPWRASTDRAFIALLVTIDVVLVVATAPNDGGGQWGPRYLLLATGPALLGIWFTLREAWRSRHILEISVIVAVVAASAAVQRQSFKELRAIKQSYGRLQHDIREAVGEGPVLTDIWWLDQVAGTHGPPPVFLTVRQENVTTVAPRLEQAAVRSFSVATTVSQDDSSRVESWLAGSAFRVSERRLLDGAVVVFAIERSAGQHTAVSDSRPNQP